LVDNEEDLKTLFDLEASTNLRLIGEQGGLSGIGLDELVFGVPNFRLINAAFTYAGPFGSRFNGPDRGAWYASFDIETALAEVIFHKTMELAEINYFNNTTNYSDILADFNCELHDLRGNDAFISSLDPNDYRASQNLAASLQGEGSLGLVYPSVRHDRGTNIACFRPALVGNVRRASSYRLMWDGTTAPNVSLL